MLSIYSLEKKTKNKKTSKSYYYYLQQSPNQERLRHPKKHSETKAKYNQEFNSMIKFVSVLFRKRALDDWYTQARSRLSAGLRKGWREINKFSSPIGSNKVAQG